MPPLALTMGEPGGIGGEIAIAAWQALRHGAERFFLIDDPDRIRAMAPPGVKVRVLDEAAEASDAFAEALPVLPEPLPAPVRPGRPSPGNAQAVLRSILRAVTSALAGEAAAVVTSPVDKRALLDGIGFPYAGHTDFLGVLAGSTEKPAMMLASGTLRVVPVTHHVPLRKVPDLLTREGIREAGRLVASALRSDFGIPSPRLAMAGLNPHAGENGMLGTEDDQIIRPAVQDMAAEGVKVSGPLPADSMFRPEARRQFDAFLCMYHDQALIPAKMRGYDNCVNVTLGLPFIRTSPAHGVAYDLAGSGLASPKSLIAALRLARKLADRRSA